MGAALGRILLPESLHHLLGASGHCLKVLGFPGSRAEGRVGAAFCSGSKSPPFASHVAPDVVP